MEDSIKSWTAKRKTTLVIEIIQGETTVSEASRSFDLTPSEIEGWAEDAKRGMENSLRANPPDIRQQYEMQLSKRQLLTEVRSNAEAGCRPVWAASCAVLSTRGSTLTSSYLRLAAGRARRFA
ncbi:DUF1153 domain-containing protein [Salipiger sp. PrR002]|uniref:DUF1153 domain-containing protein n=1 Tax=Salipiger sp. PrR002 TaxID=2706489 RepID=UPI001F173890|nr:DUF1153 domain-containing protein [Salipiger sp. PrR002]